MIRKLTTIIVVSFVVINSVFLAGVSFISYQFFFDFTSKEISETRLTLLNESTKKLSGIISSISEAGILIAANRDLGEVFFDEPKNTYDAIVEQREITGILNGITSLKSNVDSIELYTNRYEAAPIVQGGVIHSLDLLEQEDWFQIFERMDNGWIPKHESPSNNKEFISYMHKLMDYRGEIVGYLKVNILAQTLFDYMHDKELLKENNEPLLLINTGGRIIAQTHSPDTFQVLNEITESIPSEPYNRLQDTYSSFSNHHQLIKHNNEMYLLLISNPNYEQWRMVQLIPIASLYAKTRELGLFILAMGIAGILLSIPFAYFIGKRINVPIQKIIQGMRRVEKGKFDTRVGRYYIEEYDILAKNFNQMTSQIDESLEKLKKESGYRREAEIRALQSQIMPHFLYNTLDMIHWRAMDHQAEDISLMVNQLSKMLRIGLSGGQKFILLRDELEHVKCYIHIQRARLKKEIDYKERVPASIKGFYIPKIILQPFIENSMRHGYEQEYEGNVQIEVIAKLHNNSEKEMLEITITDYGVGLPDEWTIESAKGIGIKNVKERIWMYCGHPYNVKLFNHIMGGASVQIILPVIKSEAELQEWTRQHKQWFDE